MTNSAEFQTPYEELEGEYDPEMASEIPEKAQKPPSAEPQKKRKKTKRRRPRRVGVNLSQCKYPTIHKIMLSERNWRRMGDNEASFAADDWNLCWTDKSIIPERLMAMRLYQRINHFPGMSEICRKDSLARNMNRMRKHFQQEYSFIPLSWHLPYDAMEFRSHISQLRNSRGKLPKGLAWISKPASGCQGKGIEIHRSVDELEDACTDSDSSRVVQQYIGKPHLINGYKYDLRMYVLVVSCDPLRMYVYDKGIARFCTVPYAEPTAKNVDTKFMHLTNYAINKKNPDFQFNDDAEQADQGGKWSLQAIWDHIEKENGTEALENVKNEIEEVFIKTLISIQPLLAHMHHTCQPEDLQNTTCFEVLGFDILLDKNLTPYLIEVNHSPSFTTDTPLDYDVKYNLINDTLSLLNIQISDIRASRRLEKEKHLKRLYGADYVRKMKEKKNDGNPEQPPLSKPEMRQKFASDRMKFELANTGDYHIIYPTPVRTKKFSKLLNEHVAAFGGQETVASRARRAETVRKLEEAKAKDQPFQKPQKRRTRTDDDETAKSRPGTRSTVARRKRSVAGDRSSRSSVQQPDEGTLSRIKQREILLAGLTPVTCVGGVLPQVANTAPPGMPPGLIIDEQLERVRLAERMLRERTVLNGGIREFLVGMFGGNGSNPPAPPAPPNPPPAPYRYNGGNYGRKDALGPAASVGKIGSRPINNLNHSASAGRSKPLGLAPTAVGALGGSGRFSSTSYEAIPTLVGGATTGPSYSTRAFNPSGVRRYGGMPQGSQVGLRPTGGHQQITSVRPMRRTLGSGGSRHIRTVGGSLYSGFK